MSGGGSKNSSTTTVQKADPWAGQQPYLTDIFGKAQALYNQPGPYYYPGDTTAPFAPQELQAQQWLQNYATWGAAQSANQALQTNSLLMNPMMMDVANNPYVQAMNQASSRDLTNSALQAIGWQGTTLGNLLGDYGQSYQNTRNDISRTLERQWLPAVDSGAVAAGQYGGSRQGLAQGLAIGDATRALTDYGRNFAEQFQQAYGQGAQSMQGTTTNALDALANMLAETNLGAYGQGVQAMGQATALNPGLVEAGAAPMRMLAGVGTQQREMSQALIDDAVNRWNYEQGLPAQKLSDYGSMVQGQYGGASTSTTEGQVPGASTGAKVAGAALTGLGTYGALAAIPALGPVAPFAAGAMALMSLFG